MTQVVLTKADIISAVDLEPNLYNNIDSHDAFTSRCNPKANVSAVGAILRSVKWNFHLWDANAAFQANPFLADLATWQERAAKLGLTLEATRLACLFLIEAECPELVTLKLGAG